MPGGGRGLLLFCSTLILLNCTPNAATDGSVQQIPFIFEAAFSPGTRVTVNQMNVDLQRVELGRLRVSSGQIVVGDPTIKTQQAYTTPVPNGNHALQMVVARFPKQRYNAFLRLLFSHNEVASWRMAIRPGQDTQTLRTNQFFGVRVNSAKILLMDAADYRHSVATGSVADDAFAKLIEIKFNSLSGFSNIKLNDPSGRSTTLLVATSGKGNGIYAGYFGFDAKGQVSVFILDFYLIPWANTRDVENLGGVAK